MCGRSLFRGIELRAVALVGLFVLNSCFATGCGRKATLSDCQLIVDRSVELQMKELKNTDPAAIAKRQQALRQELDSEMKDCTGRRVTEGMMNCVRNAASSADLEKCVR